MRFVWLVQHWALFRKYVGFFVRTHVIYVDTTYPYMYIYIFPYTHICIYAMHAYNLRKANSTIPRFSLARICCFIFSLYTFIYFYIFYIHMLVYSYVYCIYVCFKHRHSYKLFLIYDLARNALCALLNV